jgi:hypothetical protein
MSKTFKKYGKDDDGHRYYKFEKSRQADQWSKDIDKYLKAGKYKELDHSLEEEDEYDDEENYHGIR